MYRLRSSTSFKFREKASVFLTELHPAEDAQARASILALLRKRDYDANHHCTAWREGIPIRAQGSDDDGEPSGTAGRPMLQVLEGAELSDILAVCIRWFGGTKLGTGGLVRAYTQGVQGALAAAREEGLLEAVIPCLQGRIDIEPDLAHLPFAVLRAFPGAQILEQGYTEGQAFLEFSLPIGQETELETAWRERSRGRSIQWTRQRP